MRRLLSLALLCALATPARAHDDIRCGTPSRLPEIIARPRPHIAFAGPPPIAKTTRDSFGAGFEVRESANFAVKWDNAAVTEERAQLILAALEDAWLVYFGEMGHAEPTGAETYRINAYITGPAEQPGIDFRGGYANVDDDGYPFFVLSEDLMPTDISDETLRHVAVHEFYHDVQLSRFAFYDNAAIWYWESTAEWASQQMYPDDLDGFLFVGAFALAPQLPLFYYGDPFGGDPIAGVHQYGTSIFPRFISEHVGSVTTIPQTWETANELSDPLRFLDQVLEDASLPEAFFEFTARNAVWDYPQRDFLLIAVESYAQAYPERSGVVARIGANGSGGWTDAPSATRPGAFGYNVIEIDRPTDGELYLAVELESAGSAGSPGAMRATLVRENGDGIQYAAVDDELTVTLDATEHTAWLVVGATSHARNENETFDYRFKIGATDPNPDPDADAGSDPDPDPDSDDGGGCGCTTSSSGSAPTASLGLFAVVLVIRKRKRKR